MKFYIKNIKQFKLKNIDNKKSIITVISKDKIPQINFKRIFFVFNNQNEIRGNHAHRKCYQFMFSLMGKIKLVCDDGFEKKKIMLEPKKNGVLVPPTIWARQEYLGKNNLLGVICNENFEEKDYIRDFEEFKKIYKL
jgi:dTDP-4-dehydrorhamnose 3,5-epimerase-like enzyme